MTAEAYDYVIVGSGAGGGTLAARLAESGAKVLLLEAGGDPCNEPADGLPGQYRVPAFHARASEHPAMSWNFKVNHYADPAQAARDDKWSAGGVLYPRASLLGGCTAHNAMIYLAAHDSDWDAIATLTGDPSWSARRMRRWARKVEDCRHRPVWRWLRHLGLAPTGHGWNGWLRVERFEPQDAWRDVWMLWQIAVAACAALRGIGGGILPWLRLALGKGDPNDVRVAGSEGVWYTPISTSGHHRTGTRERLLDVASRHPGCLTLQLNALVTRVLLDEQARAVGVEYRQGERLYGVCARPSGEDGVRRQVHARKEVILCGGAFNSPQLLMLSGIGPREQLDAHGIRCQVELPGVGANLQDRYEVGLIYRMQRPWASLAGARFAEGDPLYRRWQLDGSGLYGSNGAALAVTRRSTVCEGDPDLFMMAMLVPFRGYYPGYAEAVYGAHDRLTWCVLKGHTRNRRGRISLASADPQEPPRIDFNYFDEGGEQDLQALVDAVQMVRDIAGPMQDASEELPGGGVRGEALKQWIRDNAWGHHASCTCAIGPREQGGVVDGNFKVHGVSGLRVVDASVFPRIPGFFIVSAIYQIAEKAADAILREPPRGESP
ncbi:GMC family oxidoreductase [Pseudomonas sp. ZM23]|uniref:GMC family oxidoreductase n=1 Tax=Pseudomonas triclosanedens TaxID=2961893 RepID=A0ABY7A850_9PSED|nr:GMC family oxidoreductase [Pseudomonas triclosanedens]MCP8466315.1 GMC family oxidoreductase [Pseudomonas triclosanedens]MCP8471841.1 GMC family oxidoreductase [Pseudomonas triclosanedens]MCP8478536.1 GMC family oxidoreductase [Pseudomonas triclosanedens]WAI52269.1 GMC family oxidoreductase [Pseudomonas triclosanedens]